MKIYRYWKLAFLMLPLLIMPLAVSNQSLAQGIFQATDTPTPSPEPTSTATATITPLPSATSTNSAPTLVPPTPLPQQAATPLPTADITVSALASVQETKILRVGTYYNAYPFTWLNEQGEIAGYEADMMRSIGVELGVEVEFVQMTRHNAINSLLRGDVDLLIGQQIHSRDREDQLDFSHPYYLNEERMVVMTDSSYGDLNQMAGLPIGVEIGSRSERALRNFSEQSGISFDIRTYFTESAALDALANGEVQGMVGELDSLRRAGRQQMRLIDQPILLEPYAIVVRRWDANLLNLLNRSLQRLKASGRIEEMFAVWFPGETMDFQTLIPVYDTLYIDERGLSDFNTDMPYPDDPVLERINSGQPIRVAGLALPEEEAPTQVRLTNELNRALIEEMARRWGAQVEFLPNSAANPVDLVANGQADLAVGANPRWDGADRVDYSLPYLQHGNRLMVPERSPLNHFRDMLGTGWWIGYFADNQADKDTLQKYADAYNVGQNIRLFEIVREQNAIYAMVVEENIKAIYGDNLRLLALMREYDQPETVRLLDGWYGDVLPIAFAVPRNDADFRALVDSTMQDMVQDGTYQNIWSTAFNLGDPLPFPVWPQLSPDEAVE